jgi:hypothetical protein
MADTAAHLVDRVLPEVPAQGERIEAGWSPRSSGGPGDPRTSDLRAPITLRGTPRCAPPTKPQALRKNGVHPALATNPATLLPASLSRSEKRGAPHLPDSGGADDGSERKQRLVPEAME